MPEGPPHLYTQTASAGGWWRLIMRRREDKVTCSLGFLREWLIKNLFWDAAPFFFLTLHLYQSTETPGKLLNSAKTRCRTVWGEKTMMWFSERGYRNIIICGGHGIMVLFYQIYKEDDVLLQRTMKYSGKNTRIVFYFSASKDYLLAFGKRLKTIILLSLISVTSNSKLPTHCVNRNN